MWGWGSSKKKLESQSQSQQRAAAQKRPPPAHDDFADPAFDDFNVDVGDISDGDLDDPALLAELQRLAGPPAKAKPKPKPAPKKPAAAAIVDVDSIVAGIDMSDDVHVNFDESDMNDPELLAALGAIGGGGGSDSDVEVAEENASPVEKKSAPTTRPPASANVGPPSPPHQATVAASSTSLEDALLENSFAPAPPLQATVASICSLSDLTEPSPRQATVAVKEPAKSSDVTPPSLPRQASVSASKPSEPRSPSSSSSGISLDALTRRQLEYKKSALDAKKANDLPRAREYLIRSKRMQEHVDALSIGADLPPGFELPPHPSTVTLDLPPDNSVARTPTKANPATPASLPSPAARLTPLKQQQRTPSKITRSTDGTPLGVVARETIDLTSPSQADTPAGDSSSANTPDLLQHLETTLESQIATCTNVAAHYFKQTNKAEALVFHKMKKALQTDLDTIRVLKSTPNAPAPHFRYSTLAYEIEQVIPKVGLDEMEVQIVRAWDLGNRDVKTDEVESYVSFDVGWPPEESDAANSAAGEGKGDTPVVKRSGAPDYGFSKKIKITRTRPFQRYLERKKATFEVFHYQRGFLLIGKKVSLGKISVPLTALLTKCEIHEVAELADPSNPRRLTGGKIEIKIRLRAPLNKPDVLKKEERWLAVDFGGGPVTTTAPTPAASGTVIPPSQPPSTPTLKPATQPSSPAKPVTALPPASAPVPSKAVSPTIPSPVQAAPVSATSPASTTSPTSPASKSDEVEDAEMQFQSVDLIVSNTVLEKELEQLDAQLITFKTQRRPIPDDLTDRKFALQLRMNTLVFRVQAGLSMEDYVKEVKQSITQHTTWALIFKNNNRKDLALQVLQRIKIMKAEVAEVEEALAAEAAG
ncbi:hypothetical protein PhCBS80983_g06139 [Powellomyces hirtus]|uniref:C2 domain-containing protein n=1 Tax=Powellomyces hirtus TaxID=109895 RepID=A0A507DQ96_9FUNG|nr:hypothetical protein PhCBS80983_g06139 [Powellomyces hirtus]